MILLHEPYLDKNDKRKLIECLNSGWISTAGPIIYEFEKKIALFNNSLENVETIFFLTSPNNAFISSSMVREIMGNGGDFKKFVPNSVLV